MSSARPHRGATVLGLAASIGGLALLIWIVSKVGTADVMAGLRQVGWGFVVILALALARQVIRSQAWLALLGAPVSLATATAATLAGDAAGNLTPLSLLVSEPAKAVYLTHKTQMLPGSISGSGNGTRQHFNFTSALAALTAENFFYSLSVALMIALGMIALLAAFPLGRTLQLISIASLGAMLAIMAGAAWLAWHRPAVVSATLARLPLGDRLTHLIERVRGFETTTYAFVHNSGDRLAAVIVCELLFHVASVAENFVTLWLLTGSTSVLTAFIFDSFQRVVNVAFRVVPLRAGVDEFGAALLSHGLGIDPAAGVTLALIRKARILTWTAVGLLLLMRRGLSVAGVGSASERTTRD